MHDPDLALEYLPALHVLQLFDLTRLRVPASHVLHDPLSYSEYVPAWQLVHFEESFGAYVPASQLVQYTAVLAVALLQRLVVVGGGW